VPSLGPAGCCIEPPHPVAPAVVPALTFVPAAPVDIAAGWLRTAPPPSAPGGAIDGCAGCIGVPGPPPPQQVLPPPQSAHESPFGQ